MSKMCSKFKPDDLVWAKQRYSITWPAKVIDHPDGKQRKKCYYVFFLGSKNVGWVEGKDVSSFPISYAENFDFNNTSHAYVEAVKAGCQIYHETMQIFSPTYQRIRLAEIAAELGGIPVFNNEINVMTPKRTEEDQGKRRKRNKDRLKVRKLFPEEELSEDEMLTGKAAEDVTPFQSSSASSTSSCIVTVNVKDYKEVIPKDAYILLERCEEEFPSLMECISTEESECPQDCIPTEESESPQDCIPTEESECPEDCIPIEESECPEDCIPTEESEWPEDCISTEESDCPQDCIPTEESEFPEDCIPTEESEWPEDELPSTVQE